MSRCAVLHHDRRDVMAGRQARRLRRGRRGHGRRQEDRGCRLGLGAPEAARGDHRVGHRITHLKAPYVLWWRV